MKKIVYGFLVLSCSLALYGCGGEQSTDHPVEAEQVKEFVLPDGERNTSDMEYAIEKMATEDAETATDVELETALNFIKENYPDFYVDNDTMEKSIYYGRLLECAYKETDPDLADLGWKTVKAVKYVYREVETIETEATQINLEKIQEILDSLS